MQRILVVEDDPVMRQKILHLLADVPDVTTDEAADDTAARSLISSNSYDLAVIDIELGQSALARMAGLKLALEKPAVVALFVSGTKDATLRSAASYLSGYDFVQKPFEDIEFSVKVMRLLETADLVKSNTPPPPSELPPGLERDPKNHTRFLWQGKQVDLTAVELGIVDLLARSYGTVVPYAKLDTVLRTGRGPNAHSSHIRNIRQAFEAKDPGFAEIVPDPGRGYMWKRRDQD